jgi:hypothetical protein
MISPKKNQAETDRWWNVLLGDLGVVPIFLQAIMRALERDDATRESVLALIADRFKDRTPGVSRAGAKSLLLLALKRQSIALPSNFDEEKNVTLRTLLTKESFSTHPIRTWAGM